MEAARRITGMRPRKVAGKWVYPHSADVLAAAHLQPIAYYIQAEQDMTEPERREYGNQRANAASSAWE